VIMMGLGFRVQAHNDNDGFRVWGLGAKCSHKRRSNDNDEIHLSVVL